jgi:hypothetical protein
VDHPSSQPPTSHIVNTEIQTALKEQSMIGWGNFFKGFVSTKIQHLINEQREGPLNQFKNVIAITWESQHKHWTHRNRDKHGHTNEEERKIKRDNLLKQAHELFLLKSQVEPKYCHKIYPTWKRIKTKCTSNLKVWISTTRQTVHYLLDVNKQADDDPSIANETPTPPPPPPNPD